jgi:myo-inositol-1(or 4)-monophosphatase
MLEKIIQIAREAGEIVRDGFGKNIEIEYKTNSSNLVTEIDKKSEEYIKAFIRKEFPDHGILAEESGGSNTDAEYVWVVDPLDGTTNFAHRFPIFSVSIGVQKNGKTIYGVVNHIMRDEMYAAELGAGAYRNGTKLSVKQNDDLSTSLLVTGFPYDIAENPSNALEIFTEMVKSSRGMRRLGSAAIDFCYVASGVFDGFWEVHLHPWDICGGKLIVEEAGGMVTNFSGEPITIHARQILCSNGQIHQQMVDVIQRVIKA